jgi:uncharacterized membrane protein
MDWAAFVAEFLHILLGIFWFGGVLYLDFIVIPSFLALPPTVFRPASLGLAKRGGQVIPGVAIGVIVLGIVRGTVFGPIKSADALGTNYGLTWLAALVIAIVTFAWGYFMLARPSERLFSDDANWALDATGNPPPATQALLKVIQRNGLIELLFFLAILVCMVLLSMGQ